MQEVGGARNSIGHLARATPKTPTPALPEGEGAFARRGLKPQTSRPLRTTTHKPQATSCVPYLPCLPQRGRWLQAGGGLFTRRWDVGCGRWDGKDGTWYVVRSL